MSGAALAGPWSQVTGTNHPAGAGQRWLFFRRRHRNHWHRLEKDLLSRRGFYILTNIAFIATDFVQLQNSSLQNGGSLL